MNSFRLRHLDSILLTLCQPHCINHSKYIDNILLTLCQPHYISHNKYINSIEQQQTQQMYLRFRIREDYLSFPQ